MIKHLTLLVIETLLLIVFKVSFYIGVNDAYLNYSFLSFDFKINTSFFSDTRIISFLFLGYIISFVNSITYSADKCMKLRRANIFLSSICLLSLLNELLKLLFSYSLTIYLDLSIFIVIIDIIVFIYLLKNKFLKKTNSILKNKLVVFLCSICLIYTILSIIHINLYYKNNTNLLESTDEKIIDEFIDKVFNNWDTESFFEYSVEELKSSDNKNELIDIFNNLRTEYNLITSYKILEYTSGDSNGNKFKRYIISFEYNSNDDLNVELILKKESGMWKIFIFNLLL